MRIPSNFTESGRLETVVFYQNLGKTTSIAPTTNKRSCDNPPSMRAEIGPDNKSADLTDYSLTAAVTLRFGLPYPHLIVAQVTDFRSLRRDSYILTSVFRLT